AGWIDGNAVFQSKSAVGDDALQKNIYLLCNCDFVVKHRVNIQIADSESMPSPLTRTAPLFARVGYVNERLLHIADQVADRPIDAQSRCEVPSNDAQHQRSHD